LRIPGIVVKWIFVFCIPFLLLAASIAGTLNSAWLYRYGFDKYDVSTTTGLADSELEKVAKGLISYFNSGEEYINITVIKEGKSFVLFSQREIVHLKDVKGLVWLDYWILLGTLLYVLGYIGVRLFWHRRRYWRQLAWGVVGGSGLTLILMLALGLGMLFNIDQLFLQFHLLSFANEFWQLDPSSDYLIMVIPQEFQYDVALFWVLGTAGAAIVLGGVAGGYLVVTRKSLHFQPQMS
jgi:integral membrane protein (TIGR01906 family)